MSAAVIVCLILAAAAAAFVFSPLPASGLMRRLFKYPKLSAPDSLRDAQEGTFVFYDLVYPSEHADSTLDLYVPRQSSGLLPVIIWVHGGAFVGGDKSDVRYFARMLAYEGCAVISMNYRRAPEARFPVPVIQIKDVCSWISDTAVSLNLDKNRIVLAGDSAGAHSCALFALTQSDEEYARQIGIEPSVPREHIKGLMLYCGPYDCAGMKKIKGIFGFMIRRAGQAYFGTKNWAEDFDGTATVRYHACSSLPPVFITDGNTHSFENQARMLESALKNAGAEVMSYFIPEGKEAASHEYQFLMDSEAGAGCFERTLQFLREYVL